MKKLFAALLEKIYKLFGIAGPVYYVNCGEALPPPLSKEEEAECISALAQ